MSNNGARLLDVDAICADIRAIHGGAERAYEQLMYPTDSRETFVATIFGIWLRRYLANGLYLEGADPIAVRVLLGNLRADERELECA